MNIFQLENTYSKITTILRNALFDQDELKTNHDDGIENKAIANVHVSTCQRMLGNDERWPVGAVLYGCRTNH